MSPARDADTRSGSSSSADAASPPSPLMLYSPTVPTTVIMQREVFVGRGGAGVGTR
jgi:hypothetical protein